MQGKKANIKSAPHFVKETWSAIVGILYCLEQVNLMVSLSEVVLYIIVLCRNAQLDELVLECSALLKKAMNLSCDFHFVKIKV